MPAKLPDTCYAAICDIHGIWRGKRLPSSKLAKLESAPIKMPLSLASVDIWGHDIEDNPIFLEAGDPDCYTLPTGRDPLIVAGADGHETALFPLWFCDDARAPHPLDPRAALWAEERKLADLGFRCGIGTELEFHLIDPQNTEPVSAIQDGFGETQSAGNVMTVAEMQATKPFLDAVHEAALQNGISLETAISEAGAGQFEIVLAYCEDALKAADSFTFLKHIIRMSAQRFGMEACFMAKPILGEAGNGFHSHISLMNGSGENVFANGALGENPLMQQAVAGMIELLPQSMLVFAPHLNSYKRFEKAALAPTVASWAIEERTAAIRIPQATGQATRIEHRIAGADANPYLVLAALLRSVRHGLDKKLAPPEAGVDGAPLAQNWHDALHAFDTQPRDARLFPDALHDGISYAKHQEQRVFAQYMSPFELLTYRGTV